MGSGKFIPPVALLIFLDGYLILVFLLNALETMSCHCSDAMCIVVVVVAMLEVFILVLGLVLLTWSRPAATSVDLFKVTFVIIQ